MKSRKYLKLSYRLIYLLGIASIIASLVIVAPLEGNVSPAFAQVNWTQSQFCGGFTLTALVAHGAVDIEARFRPIDDGTWGNAQNWSLPAGGPATYTFNYNPQLPPGYEVLFQIRDDQNNVIFQEKVDLAPCAPTSTPTTPPPPPTATPTDPAQSPTPTGTPVTPPPTDTPPPTTPPPTDTPPPTTPPPTVPPTTPPPTAPPTTPPPTTPPPTIPPPTTPPPTEPTPTEPTPTEPPPTTPPPTIPPPTTPPPTEPPGTPPPTNPPSTATPIQPPSSTGTPPVLIPVTGIDLGGQPEFSRRLLQNVGLGLLGIGLVLNGLTLRIKKED